MNPLGSSLKAHRAESRAWTRSSVKRRPGTRVPAGVVMGLVIAVIAAAPAAGSWLIFWTLQQAPVGGEADLPQCGQVR